MTENKAFEESFKEEYIKTGFVWSKEQAQVFYEAGQRHLPASVEAVLEAARVALEEISKDYDCLGYPDYSRVTSKVAYIAKGALETIRNLDQRRK